MFFEVLMHVFGQIVLFFLAWQHCSAPEEQGRQPIR